MGQARIVIIGGGFGGVKCADILSRKLGPDAADLVLFNSENHMVFSPLLAEVVGSSINPLDVIVPLRQLLPKVFCRTEEVKNIDFGANRVEFQSEGGQACSMAYDHLVITCGNVTNLNVVPGMADHSFPLKTVGDAAALRSHGMEQLEKAEVCDDKDRRQWHLTFVVVGGGFSGAEAAGEINDLVRSSARYFRNFRRDDVKVTLIHSRDQILPEISPNLREFARKQMEKAGVNMILNARVALVTSEGVGLESGAFVPGGTIVCTIGNSAAALVERQPSAKEKGRLLTDPDMRLRGSTNVWAIGDCALISNTFDNNPVPTTGQFAEREGRQCAENIIRVLRKERTLPFRFKPLGELCSIGGHSAVADLLGWHLSGFFAWFVWRGVYLFKLPTWARRFQVGFDWAFLLAFPRDLAHIRTRTTDRVSRAHYRAGDLIITRGEPPTNFYVVEHGEVEVLKPGSNPADGEVVVVLGPGSFFGERALMGDRPRVASVRARTAVEVLVMGRNVFTQISGALEPLRNALAQTLNRRAIDPWRDSPRAYELLQHTGVRELLEPVPEPLLSPDATLRDVSRAFIDHGNDFYFVSSNGRSLEGVVTMTDLLRGRSAGATTATPVSEFMTKNPVTISSDDTCALAASTMREYRLKSLPIVEGKDDRRLVGCIRLRHILAYMFKKLDQAK